MSALAPTPRGPRHAPPRRRPRRIAKRIAARNGAAHYRDAVGCAAERLRCIEDLARLAVEAVDHVASFAWAGLLLRLPGGVL